MPSSYHFQQVSSRPVAARHISTDYASHYDLKEVVHGEYFYFKTEKNCVKEVTRMTSRKMLLSVFLVFALLFVQVVGIAQGDEKLLRVRLANPLNNMDPTRSTSGEFAVGLCLYPQLVRFKASSNELENYAAEWVDVSQDGLEITFKLNEGIQWQRGYGELTTEDVKWSFERSADPEVSTFATDWDTLVGVEIIDRYTAKIILSEVYSPLFTSTLPWMAGVIVCKKAYDELGDVLWSDPVGVGPYEWADWQPNQKLTLTRSSNYFGTAPYYDTIEFYPIKESNVAEIAFEAGELDFLSVDLASRSRYENLAGARSMPASRTSWYWVGFNVQHPAYDDIRIRQAVRYAIDSEEVIQAGYFGAASVARGIIAPGLLGFSEDGPLFPPTEENLQKARDLLADAGFPNGFTTDLWTVNNPANVRMTEVIAENLKKINIRTEIKVSEWSVFEDSWLSEDEEVRNNSISLFTMGYAGGADPAWTTAWYVPEQVGVWNAMQWTNEEFGRLHKEATKTYNLEWRELIYLRMQQIMNEDCVGVWLTFPPILFVMEESIAPAFLATGIVQYVFFTASE